VKKPRSRQGSRGPTRRADETWLCSEHAQVCPIPKADDGLIPKYRVWLMGVHPVMCHALFTVNTRHMTRHDKEL
jgi:hypothetical protein